MPGNIMQAIIATDDHAPSAPGALCDALYKEFELTVERVGSPYRVSTVVISVFRIEAPLLK
jgi:hypothetical protein